MVQGKAVEEPWVLGAETCVLVLVPSPPPVSGSVTAGPAVGHSEPSGPHLCTGALPALPRWLLCRQNGYVFGSRLSSLALSMCLLV